MLSCLLWFAAMTVEVQLAKATLELEDDAKVSVSEMITQRKYLGYLNNMRSKYG